MRKAFTLVECLIVIAILGIIVALVLPMSGCFVDKAQSIITATVRDKDSIRMGSADFAYSTYLIYTDKETLENIENFLLDKSRAETDRIYGLIERGKTYKFTVIGTNKYGNYRNIISIEEVKLPAEKE